MHSLGDTQTGHCGGTHRSAPGCLELAAAPTLLSYPCGPGWVGSGSAHLGTWHSNGLVGVFLGYSGRAEVWSQSPRSPETQGPAQVDCQRANGHAQNSPLWSNVPFKKDELVGVAITSISHTKNTDSKVRRIHTCPDSQERSPVVSCSTEGGVAGDGGRLSGRGRVSCASPPPAPGTRQTPQPSLLASHGLYCRPAPPPREQGPSKLQACTMRHHRKNRTPENAFPSPPDLLTG